MAQWKRPVSKSPGLIPEGNAPSTPTTASAGPPSKHTLRTASHNSNSAHSYPLPLLGTYIGSHVVVGKTMVVDDPVLTSFSVENYKAFSRRQKIDIRPLTLFFGWNSG